MSAIWILCVATSARAIDIIQSNVGIGCSSVCIGTQCIASCSGTLPAPTDGIFQRTQKDVKGFDSIRVEAGIDPDLGHDCENSVTVFADGDAPHYLLKPNEERSYAPLADHLLARAVESAEITPSYTCEYFR